MASLDSLPADQRAVIQLVLQRGRSYDDIASMLSIDRAAVRQRALDAFDALGPSSSLPAPQRALLTDYLLGQLPPRVAEQVAGRLAQSPPDRAWVRVIASEITPLATKPLPEIPVAAAPSAPAPPASATRGELETGAEPWAEEPGAESEAASRAQVPEPRRRERGAPQPSPAPGSYVPTGSAAERATPTLEAEEPLGVARPASSRRGGAIILGVVAVAIAAVVVILIATGGSSPKHPSSTASRPPTTSTPASTTGTTTTPKLVTQVNLVSPSGGKTTAGIAQVIREGSTLGVVILAQGVPANTSHNAYAVWLFNSSGDSKLVGFVNQRVGSNGKLETEGPLPANASHYKQMLVTLETQSKPKAPGQIVLEGSLSLS